jgi:hypothetical protein
LVRVVRPERPVFLLPLFVTLVTVIIMALILVGVVMLNRAGA